MCRNYKGVIPITKNIIVVDESGNEYTSTYAKRAKGLVKNGRARWLDGNTICLVCPPDTLDLEDNNMENRAENTTINEVSENNHFEKTSTATGQSTVSVADILDRIDQIIAQGNQLQNAVMQIQNLPVNDSPEGGRDGAERARAINNIYAAREATNQKLIGLLERMYDDLMQSATCGNGTDSARFQEMQRAKALKTLSGVNFAGVNPQTAEAILSFMQNSLM